MTTTKKHYSIEYLSKRLEAYEKMRDVFIHDETGDYYYVTGISQGTGTCGGNVYLTYCRVEVIKTDVGEPDKLASFVTPIVPFTREISNFLERFTLVPAKNWIIELNHF